MTTPLRLCRAATVASLGVFLPLALLASEKPLFRALDVGATPESVVRGFEGKLYVTLMGTARTKGDGDGKVVLVDGDNVSDFATGLDDPKGIVFTGGRLITTDFDKVWAIDATGAKALLAGPGAFPAPPLFLNDVVVERDGASVLVTDMGNLAAMFSGPRAFWPLESEQAKSITPLGRVYRVGLDGKVALVIDHAPEMPNPNGVDLLPDGTILVGEFFHGTLMAWKDGAWKQLSDDHRSADGIVHAASAEDIYVTEVFSGRVWHVRRTSGEKRLLATLQSAADLLLDGDILIVPDSAAGRLVFIPVGR